MPRGGSRSPGARRRSRRTPAMPRGGSCRPRGRRRSRRTSSTPRGGSRSRRTTCASPCWKRNCGGGSCPTRGRPSRAAARTRTGTAATTWWSLSVPVRRGSSSAAISTPCASTTAFSARAWSTTGPACSCCCAWRKRSATRPCGARCTSSSSTWRRSGCSARAPTWRRSIPLRARSWSTWTSSATGMRCCTALAVSPPTTRWRATCTASAPATPRPAWARPACRRATIAVSGGPASPPSRSRCCRPTRPTASG